MYCDEIKKVVHLIQEDAGASLKKYSAISTMRADTIREYWEDADKRLNMVQDRLDDLDNQIHDVDKDIRHAQVAAAEATIRNDSEAFNMAQADLADLEGKRTAIDGIYKQIRQGVVPRNSSLYDAFVKACDSLTRARQTHVDLCSDLERDIDQCISVLDEAKNWIKNSVKEPDNSFGVAKENQRVRNHFSAAVSAVDELQQRAKQQEAEAERQRLVAEQEARFARQAAEARERAEAMAKAEPAPYRTVQDLNGIRRERWDPDRGEYVPIRSHVS